MTCYEALLYIIRRKKSRNDYILLVLLYFFASTNSPWINNALYKKCIIEFDSIEGDSKYE